MDEHRQTGCFLTSSPCQHQYVHNSSMSSLYQSASPEFTAWRAPGVQQWRAQDFQMGVDLYMNSMKLVNNLSFRYVLFHEKKTPNNAVTS